MPSKLDQLVDSICEKWQRTYGDERPFPNRSKTIQDPVHGAIEVEREMVFILDSVMMQRLRWISQLGFANEVFPGANHTRFEHSLGVMHLVGRILERIGKQMNLTDDQILEAKAAGLLHDVGHLPFSHVPEPLLENDLSVMSEATRLKIKPSEVLTMRIISSQWMQDIFDTINKQARRNLNVKNVANLAVGYAPTDAPKLKFLGELAHADFDADRMDYLMRDAHYTGVPLGTLDKDRLIRTTTVRTSVGKTKHLAIDVKGLHSLESMIVARSMMYSTVYFHHAVRAANAMLLRAIRMTFHRAPLKLLEYDDSSLVNLLCREKSNTRRIAKMLISRNIYKPALKIKISHAKNEPALMDFLGELTLDLTIDHENHISREVRNDGRNYCMLDMPRVERYSEIDANIVENGTVSAVKQHSKIAEGVGNDPNLKWRGYVFSVRDKVDQVREKALKYLDQIGLTFSEAASSSV